MSSKKYPLRLVFQNKDSEAAPIVILFKAGDDPSARQLDISTEFSKRITDTFGVSVGSTWTHLRPPGGLSPSGSR